MKYFILNQLRNPAFPRVLIVTPAVYPHLVDFTWTLNFHFKNRPTQLRLKTQLRTFPWFSQAPQSKFEANRSRVPELLSDKQTDKQRFLLNINRLKRKPEIVEMLRIEIKNIRRLLFKSLNIGYKKRRALRLEQNKGLGQTY